MSKGPKLENRLYEINTFHSRINDQEGNDCFPSSIEEEQSSSHFQTFKSLLSKILSPPKTEKFKSAKTIKSNEKKKVGLFSFLKEAKKIKNVKKAIDILKRKSRSFFFEQLKKTSYNIIGDLTSEWTSTSKKKNSNKEKKIPRPNFLLRIKRIWKSMPLIHPNSQFKLFWDLLILIVVFIDFIFLSLSLSFDMNFSDDDYYNNIVLEFGSFMLFCDMIFKFKTCVYDHGILVKNHKNISRKYLKGNFVLDLCSLASLLLYLTLFENTNMKWVSLMFFFQFKNLRSIIRNFENKIELGDFYELFSLMFKVVLVGHVYACIWYLVSIYSGSQKNWISSMNLQEYPWQIKYLYSFYWALATMVTVGYGDITPKNPYEVLFCCFTILTGSLMFGFCLNKIGVLLTLNDERNKELKQNVKLIENYMKNHNINADLKARTISFIEDEWKLERKNLQKEQNLIENLPESLKKEILYESNKKSLNQFQILKNNFGEEILNKLSSCLQIVQFSPKEIIYSQNDYETDNPNLYLIDYGQVEVYFKDNVLRTIEGHKTFGEREFFLNIPYEFTIKSATFTMGYKIPRKFFINLLKGYPEQYEIFCNIKDNLLFQDDHTPLMNPCYSCSARNHPIFQCPLISYQPQKDTIIQRLNFSKDQRRENNIFIFKRKKQSSLAIMKLVNKKAFRIHYNQQLMDTFQKSLKTIPCSEEEKLSNCSVDEVFLEHPIQKTTSLQFINETNKNKLNFNKEWSSMYEIKDEDLLNFESDRSFLVKKKSYEEICFVPNKTFIEKDPKENDDEIPIIESSDKIRLNLFESKEQEIFNRNLENRVYSEESAQSNISIKIPKGVKSFGNIRTNISLHKQDEEKNLFKEKNVPNHKNFFHLKNQQPKCSCSQGLNSNNYSVERKNRIESFESMTNYKTQNKSEKEIKVLNEKNSISMKNYKKDNKIKRGYTKKKLVTNQKKVNEKHINHQPTIGDKREEKDSSLFYYDFDQLENFKKYSPNGNFKNLKKTLNKFIKPLSKKSPKTKPLARYSRCFSGAIKRQFAFGKS